MPAWWIRVARGLNIQRKMPQGVIAVRKRTFRIKEFNGLLASQRCVTHCGLVMQYGATDLCQHWPGNGLVSGGTKPLPGQMLTCHRWVPVMFICMQFHKRYLSHQSLKLALKITCPKFHSNPPGANELMALMWHACYFHDTIHATLLVVTVEWSWLLLKA